MRNFIILLFFNILVSINVYATNPGGPIPDMFAIDESFCQDTLNKEIEKLIKQDDSEILMNSFNVASLKLAHRVLKNDGKGETLEKHVRRQIRKLKDEDKSKLTDQVVALYRKFGKPANLTKINKIIEGLDEHNYFPKSQRLSNEDTAVMMMAYEYLDPCQDSMLCINETDTSIVWFMDHIAKKVDNGASDTAHGNLLRTTVKIAHNTGVFESTQELSSEQIKDRISQFSRKNRKIMKDFHDNFKDKFEVCYEALGGESCFAKAADEAFQNNLNGILSELEQNSIEKIPGKMKVKLSDGMTLNLSKNLYFNKIELPEDKGLSNYPNPLDIVRNGVEKVDGSAPITCGGKTYEAETKIIDMWSLDPLRLMSNIKNYGKKWPIPTPENFDRLNRKHQNKLDKQAKSGGKGAKLMALFNHFCPKFPVSLGPVFWFKCGSFMKWFVLRYKRSETLVCCKEETMWREHSNLLIGSSGGVEGKVFAGIPELVEFGGMLGLSLSFTAGAPGFPQGCTGTKNCFSATLMPSIYGGLYLNLGVKDKLKSAIGAEGKIAWKPTASLLQCLSPASNPPKAKVKLSMGSIYLQGTVYAGWVFTYDFYKLLHEFKNADEFDIGIL